MNIPLIKDLLSWVIDHADFTFPYASSVPVRALIFLFATLCFFVIAHYIEKWSRKKKNPHQKEQTIDDTVQAKNRRPKTRKTLFHVFAVLVIFLSVASIRTTYITKFGKYLFYDKSTQVIVKGDYNWIELDSENKLLYVAGHSTDQVLAYDTTNLSNPAKLSESTNENAQSFALNLSASEMYYPTADEIIVFNVPDLTIKERIPIPHLARGDVWIVWDQQNGQIILSSEADEDSGSPFLIIDRKSGNVVYDEPLNAWNIYLNPSQSILYMGSSFRDDRYYLLDTKSHEVVNSVETGEFGNRMVLDMSHDELLIATPFKSKIIRYDPLTLENKGSINGNIGVRSVAIDQKNSLLFAGSIVDNTLRIIDLNTYKVLRTYWVGPWVRSIVPDSEHRLAYISTRYDVICIAY